LKPSSLSRFSSVTTASMSFWRVPNFSFTAVKVAWRRRSFALDTSSRPLSALVRATQRSPLFANAFTASTSFALPPNLSLTSARGDFAMGDFLSRGCTG